MRDLDRDVDERLACRERELPGLAALLDDERLGGLLRRCGWLAPGERVRVDRVRLKPGTRAQAAVQRQGDGRWLLATAFSRNSWAKASKDRQVARRHGSPTLVDEGALMLLCHVVADRDLPALRDLRPDEAAGAGPRARTIGYNPARRWVGALHTAGSPAPLALVKVHADARTGPHTADAAALLRAVGVDTPPVTSLPGGVVVAPWVAGRHPDPRSPADASAVAALLGRLSTTRRDEPTWTRVASATLPAVGYGDVLDRARTATSALTVLDPAAGARARRVLADLAPMLSLGAEDLVPVHGDLSPDQVLIGADGPVLLDLDRAALGPRGWDAASWLAAQAAGGVPCEELVALPGIGVPGALLAAAALQRAPEPWRRRRPGRSAATGVLIDVAEAGVGRARSLAGAGR